MIFVLILFFLFLIMGIPVAFTMGFSALLYLLINGRDLITMTQRMFAGTDSFTLMAIPLFMFAGEIMNSCGVTRRLSNFANTCVGFLPGGLAHVNVLGSMLMAGISGSTLADVASLGAIEIEAMTLAGYDRKYSASLTAASATIGSIIPPSIMMVLYASITGISVGKLFLAGFIPGVLTGLAQMVYGLIMAKHNPQKYDGKNLEFNLREFGRSFIDVIPALVMPLIIIGGILSGVFTATEAGAMACVWGLLVGIFVYREFDVKTIVRTMVNGIKTSGMVMLIVAGAMLFSYCLAIEQFPAKVSAIITGISTTPSVVMVLMIICMLIIGCFMDATPAAIIMVPIFQPIAASMGFDGIHFGLVIVLTLIMAGITPPVGVTLFVTCAVAKLRFSELLKEMWPFIIISTAILFLIAYVPTISLWLPNLIR